MSVRKILKIQNLRKWLEIGSSFNVRRWGKGGVDESQFICLLVPKASPLLEPPLRVPDGACQSNFIPDSFPSSTTNLHFKKPILPQLLHKTRNVPKSGTSLGTLWIIPKWNNGQKIKISQKLGGKDLPCLKLGWWTSNKLLPWMRKKKVFFCQVFLPCLYLDSPFSLSALFSPVRKG